MAKSTLSPDRLQTFVRIVDRGSFSAVAREMRAGQATISRHVRELEDDLGAALLSRTTRRIKLTDEGALFYERCQQILRLIDTAQAEVRHGRAALGGTVRVSCTSAFGIRHLTRILFEFQDSHPEIEIDLNLTDERIDLVKEGVDLAVRLGPVTDSSAKLRALGHSRRILVASPHYLARRGRPESVKELREHDHIRMSNIAGNQMLALEGPDGAKHMVDCTGRLAVDNGLAARAALLAGRGIAPAHIWLVYDAISAGQLQPVLPQYSPTSVPLSMLLSPGRTATARVRRVADFLAKNIPQIPGIDHRL